MNAALAHPTIYERPAESTLTSQLAQLVQNNCSFPQILVSPVRTPPTLDRCGGRVDARAPALARDVHYVFYRELWASAGRRQVCQCVVAE